MSDALFDLDPNHPDAPVRASFVRRLKEEADPGEPSPFGSAMPEDLPAPEGYGRSIAQVRTKGVTFKGRDHYPRAKAYMEKLVDGFFWTCDRQVPTPRGLIAQDLLGFMDLQGVSGSGRLIGVNVTTRDAIKAHIRDYTNPANTHGQARTPVPELLRRFLEHEARFYVLGFHQEGGKGSRWAIECVEVTLETMAEYEARKRKGRG